MKIAIVIDVFHDKQSATVKVIANANSVIHVSTVTDMSTLQDVVNDLAQKTVKYAMSKSHSNFHLDA